MKITTYNNPFKYFIIEDLLSEHEYKELKKASLSSVIWETSHEYQDQFGMITSHEVLRKIAGKEIRTLIFDQLGLSVSRHKKSVPQLRCTTGITNGVSIHTDSDCSFKVAVFLHLTDWVPGMGGNLQIWSKNEMGFKLENVVAPKPNTLVVLAFSNHSFHSVTPVTKNTQRVTLISEWSLG